MIEIKNTKVKLYTVKEYKEYHNVTNISDAIEKVLRNSEGMEIILFKKLPVIFNNSRYAGARQAVGTYDFLLIESFMIKEEIIDTGAKAAILGDLVLGTYNPEEKPPLGLIPREHYKRISNVSRIGDILDAMDRYTKKEKTLPIDWIDELRERIDIVKEN